MNKLIERSLYHLRLWIARLVFFPIFFIIALATFPKALLQGEARWGDLGDLFNPLIWWEMLTEPELYFDCANYFIVNATAITRRDLPPLCFSHGADLSCVHLDDAVMLNMEIGGSIRKSRLFSPRGSSKP